jgi:hypothetical protein
MKIGALTIKYEAHGIQSSPEPYKKNLIVATKAELKTE